MLDNIISIVGVILVITGYFIAWSKLLNKKIEFKNWKLYLSIIVLTFLLIFNYNNIDKMLKVVFITVCSSIVIKLNFKVNTKISLVTAFYTQIINVIIELIYSIIIMLFFNVQSGIYSTLIIFFADFLVAIFEILIVKLKFVKRIYQTIINVINKLSLKTFFVFLLPLCFIFNVYLVLTYYSNHSILYIIINNISIYLILIIVYILIKKENEYTKIYDKYNTTINSLKEYEDILDKYRVSNHENKNQLLTIRNMIVEKDKKVAKYIDELVKNKIKDDEKIMQEVSVIPAGGLRGLIYSKILDMKEKNIEYELNISKDIRTVDLINNLNDSDMLDICQIIGVYIDNAIEAVIDIKDKYINFDMYLENNYLVFEISNYYKGKIELDKLEEKGYTTKSNGHGYGLSLTKEIISSNKKLKNEKRLSKETFTQVLKIKIK